MPVSKNARFRYKIIDSCLRRSGVKWTKQALMEKVNSKLQQEGYLSVSLSTIRYDITNITREYGAEIQVSRRGNDVYYCYPDSDYSIFNNQLSSYDLGLLEQALAIFKQMKGIDFMAEVEYVIKNLEQKILNNEKDHPIILLENKPIAIGTDYIQDFYICIKERKVLRMKYHRFNSPNTQTIIIHPYFIKEYNSRWYLVAIDEKFPESISTYGLDRIIELKPEHRVYLPVNIDFEKMLSSRLGVSNGFDNNNDEESIIIEVRNQRVDYFLTKKIHHSQQEIERLKNGEVLFSYSLIINKELVSTLLSFGGDLRVKAPERLVKIMNIEIGKMSNTYQA